MGGTSGRPAGVTELEIPRPREISGVAAVDGAFAVVGDEDDKHVHLWPGGERRKLPAGVKRPESIDIAADAEGEQLWLVLCEKRGRVRDFRGGKLSLGKATRLDEAGGRGFEGLALKHADGRWQAAAVWEGGYFSGKEDRGKCAQPVLALFDWLPGKGAAGPVRKIALSVPEPGGEQRFRAPDLVWLGDDLLVLLVATDEKRKRQSFVWLQRFGPDGSPIGDPVRLEDLWGDYATKRKWEALDWAPGDRQLVLGHDAKKESKLALLQYGG
jgi:hypothetical protein